MIWFFCCDTAKMGYFWSFFAPREQNTSSMDFKFTYVTLWGALQEYRAQKQIPTDKTNCVV